MSDPTLRTTDTWVACVERMPEVSQQVVLANVTRLKSHDPHGCAKDVGTLESLGDHRYWSTQGETRAMSLEAFTHWMLITEPAS